MKQHQNKANEVATVFVCGRQILDTAANTKRLTTDNSLQKTMIKHKSEKSCVVKYFHPSMYLSFYITHALMKKERKKEREETSLIKMQLLTLRVVLHLSPTACYFPIFSNA